MRNPLHACSLAELTARLNQARQERAGIASIDLRGFEDVLEHAPADMTVRVAAGFSLQKLQECLSQHGQWLPIDPPFPEKTLGALLAANAGGPRRFGYGTVRDWVIGLRVVTADGALIKSGGNVVKNVAGYDLAKIFIGSRGTLGVIVEASFKLRPLPEREAFVQASFKSLPPLAEFLACVRQSRLAPVVFDVHNVTGPLTVVLGFDGAPEDVADALEEAAKLGAGTPSDLSHSRAFWDRFKSARVHKHSVLPSGLCQALEQIAAGPFVAHAGNGIVYSPGPAPPARGLPRQLFKRLKETFDPDHLFPELPE